MKKITATALIMLMSLGTACAQQNILETAQKVNNYFMKKYADPTVPTFVKKERASSLWTRAVYYEGLMSLYAIDKQQRYLDYTDTWANFHKWTPRNGTTTTDADDQCCAQTYLDRYKMEGGNGKIDKVKENLDKQISSGKADYWTWIDAIQMSMPVYARMYNITKDRKYIDYAMNAYNWSRNTCGGGLFNTKNGLWWRDKDFVPPYKENDGKDCYWSRGNGWVYAALVRVMNELSPKDKYYKELKNDFIKMSAGIISCQHEDGFWYPSLVSTNYAGKEMTGTALFLYGMSWGINKGYLNKKVYLPACIKAWKALEECAHEDGFIGWNQGTGKDPSAGQPVTYTSVPDFEDYGTGCFLLGASEYYKLNNK